MSARIPLWFQKKCQNPVKKVIKWCPAKRTFVLCHTMHTLSPTTFHHHFPFFFTFGILLSPDMETVLSANIQRKYKKR